MQREVSFPEPFTAWTGLRISSMSPQGTQSQSGRQMEWGSVTPQLRPDTAWSVWQRIAGLREPGSPKVLQGTGQSERNMALGHISSKSSPKCHQEEHDQVDEEHWPRDNRNQKIPSPHCRKVTQAIYLRERNTERLSTIAKEAEKSKRLYLNQLW